MIHDAAWQKPTQYCKATVPQLKINTFLKRKKKVFLNNNFSQVLGLIFIPSLLFVNLLSSPLYQNVGMSSLGTVTYRFLYSHRGVTK